MGQGFWEASGTHPVIQVTHRDVYPFHNQSLLLSMGRHRNNYNCFKKTACYIYSMRSAVLKIHYVSVDVDFKMPYVSISMFSLLKLSVIFRCWDENNLILVCPWIFPWEKIYTDTIYYLSWFFFFTHKNNFHTKDYLLNDSNTVKVI